MHIKFPYAFRFTCTICKFSLYDCYKAAATFDKANTTLPSSTALHLTCIKATGDNTSKYATPHFLASSALETDKQTTLIYGPLAIPEPSSTDSPRESGVQQIGENIKAVFVWYVTHSIKKMLEDMSQCFTDRVRVQIHVVKR